MLQTHLLPTQQVADLLGPIAAHILLMIALWAMNPYDLHCHWPDAVVAHYGLEICCGSCPYVHQGGTSHCCCSWMAPENCELQK